MSERVLGQLTPAQCIDRVKTLLESRTVLDEVEERRLLLISMAEHLDWLRDQRENPKSWNAIARSYKLLSDQIERTNINVNDVSTRLAASHAEYFVNGFMIGFDKALSTIAASTDQPIDAEVVSLAIEAGVVEAKSYIDGVTLKSVE